MGTLEKINGHFNWISLAGLIISMVAGGAIYVNMLVNALDRSISRVETNTTSRMETASLRNDINRIETNLNKITERFHDHRTDWGHPGVKAFDDKLKEMDDKLQQEIGRVEDLMDTQFELNIKNVHTRIDGLEEQKTN